jgi:TetR/AcrR family transcriptional regulator, tetracycline repressor protein
VRLRRDDVIDAALALLDERGLDGLTTRRLAERLGVRAGALYWHVRDKRELLTALADRIVTQAQPAQPPAGDWAAYLIDGARQLRAAMLAHPDGARLVAAYAPVSPQMLRAAEAGLQVMCAHGVPLAAAAYAGDAIMSYVTGFVLQEQTTPTRPEDSEQTTAGLLADLPLLAEWTATKPSTKDEAFAAGLDHIITGIRVRLSPETRASAGQAAQS